MVHDKGLRCALDVEMYLREAGNSELVYSHVLSILQSHGFGVGVARDKIRPPIDPRAIVAHLQGVAHGMVYGGDVHRLERALRVRGIEFHERETFCEHEYEVHATSLSCKHSGHLSSATGECRICDGGLSVCNVCGGAEAELTAECVGRKLTSDESRDVVIGFKNFVDGAWIVCGRAE